MSDLTRHRPHAQREPRADESRLLRELLATLYDDPDRARMIADDAGIPTERIDFAGGAELVWWRILGEADKLGPAARYRLRLRAHEDYPDRAPLPAAPPPPVAAPLERYLDWGWRHYRQVPLLGYHNRDRIRLTLDEVFVELLTRVGYRGAQPGDRRYERDSPNIDAPQHVNLEGALALVVAHEKAGLALVGDPGAGKTTLLRHLFCRVRAEGSAAVGLPAGLVPVFLRFADLQDGDRCAGGLAHALRRQLSALDHAGAGEQLAREKPPILFLLDGLDEVRDRRARIDFSRWLEDEVFQWPGSRFVTTCRFAAWEAETRLASHFLAAEVSWLSPERVADYVRRWYFAVVVGQLGRPEEAKARADELTALLLDPRREADFRLREMTQNPLLLSTLCLVHRAGHKLPDRRVDLYDECVGFLLETWTHEGGRLGLPDKAARQVLQPLAWAMHSRQGDEARGREATPSRPMRFHRTEVKACLAQPFTRVRGLDVDLKEFLRRARDECGLLTGADEESYEFLHLSFQEYLAAGHAVGQRREAELAARAGEPFWREAVLLAMAMDGAYAPFVAEVVRQGRVAELEELLRACMEAAPLADPTPLQVVLAQPGGWRGWMRRLLGGGPAQQEVRATLTLLRGCTDPAVIAAAERWCGHADPAVAAAAQAVAAPSRDAATPPPAPDPVGIEWVRVPAGTFWMGSSDEAGHPACDSEAIDDEQPARETTVSYDFRIARFPVTNAQYAAFLTATGHAAPLMWNDRRFNDPLQPVVGVDWSDALAFCAWLNSIGAALAGAEVDLPTEAEWEYAARGRDARRFPWGTVAPDAQLAVFAAEGPRPVGKRPLGRSPWGVEEMAGNVWEWTRDAWMARYLDAPRLHVDICHVGVRDSPRVVRGGSWKLLVPRYLRCAFLNRLEPEFRSDSLGFRVVCRGSGVHAPLPLDP